MSPGLKRAREPYRVRNAVTGLLMAGFGVGVWAYSISAVKQDVFDDVDEEARALTGSGMRSLEDEEREKAAAKQAAAVVACSPVLLPAKKAEIPPVRTGRGVLVQLLDKQIPGLFDPQRKTLVWGAPPVDNIGRTSDH